MNEQRGNRHLAGALKKNIDRNKISFYSRFDFYKMCFLDISVLIKQL